MKITYRIPTEMYAYVEIEAEVGPDAITAENIVSNYKHYADAFKNGAGLSANEWKSVLDRLWKNRGFTEEELSKFNEYQISFYKDFRNTRARAKQSN